MRGACVNKNMSVYCDLPYALNAPYNAQDQVWKGLDNLLPSIQSLAFDCQGQYCALYFPSGYIQLLDVTNNVLLPQAHITLPEVNGLNFLCNSFVWSLDSKRIIGSFSERKLFKHSHSSDNHLFVWDVASMSLLYNYR